MGKLSLRDKNLIRAASFIGQKFAKELDLNYSEQSLYVVDAVLAIQLKSSAVPLETVHKWFSRSTYEALQRFLRDHDEGELIAGCVNYVGEVVCRNVRGAWTVRHGFFGGAELGIDIEDGKRFLPLKELAGIPSKTYIKIRSRIQELSVDRVELSSKPR